MVCEKREGCGQCRALVPFNPTELLNGVDFPLRLLSVTREFIPNRGDTRVAIYQSKFPLH